MRILDWLLNACAPLGFLGAVGASIAGSVVSSALSGSAANSAANTQANAQDAATNAQLQMFNTVQAENAPYRQVGQNALGQLQILSGQADPTNPNFNSFSHSFDASDLNSNLSPGYQFALDQGNRATTNMANLSGGAFSGNTLAAISQYNVGAAQQGYQQAYENYNTNQGNIFNRLADIAGIGQTANAQSAGSANAMSPGIASTIAGAGASRAGGTIGTANALSSGVNNASSWYSLGSILNGNTGGSGGYGGGVGTTQSYANLGGTDSGAGFSS